MLRKLSIRARIVFLPLLAGLAFLTLFLLVRQSGARYNTLMGEIEEGYFPALSLSHDLAQSLGSIQRAFDDATLSSSVGSLETAEALRNSFLARIATGSSNPTLDTDLLAAVRREFQSYYETGLEATLNLIQNGATEESLPQLEAMSMAYQRVETRLDRLGDNQTSELNSALTTAREQGHDTTIRMSLLLGGSLIVLFGLSYLIVKSVTVPLARAVRAAEEMARGDVESDLTIQSNDEIGQFMRSLQDTVVYLRKMSSVAEQIARGDLSVQVEPRSEKDTFGKAFKKMAANLQQMIGNVK